MIGLPFLGEESTEEEPWLEKDCDDGDARERFPD